MLIHTWPEFCPHWSEVVGPNHLSACLTTTQATFTTTHKIIGNNNTKPLLFYEIWLPFATTVQTILGRTLHDIVYHISVQGNVYHRASHSCTGKLHLTTCKATNIATSESFIHRNVYYTNNIINHTKWGKWFPIRMTYMYVRTFSMSL